MMTCRDLAAQIERLQPGAPPRHVARLCLLLSNVVDDLDALEDETALCDAWSRVYLQMQSFADQHAAMTEDLERLAQCDLHDLSQDSALLLMRALKTQSRVLDFYIGSPASSA